MGKEVSTFSITRENDGFLFRVKQKRLGPLKGTALVFLSAIGCFLLTTLGVYTLSNDWGILFLIIGLIGVLMILLGFITLIGSIFVFFFTPEFSAFRVNSKGIELIEKNSAKYPDFLSFADISAIYVKYSDENEAAHKTTTYASPAPQGSAAATISNVGSNTGKALGDGSRSILNKDSAKIVANYQGREIIITKRISDSEAEYLLSKIDSSRI